METSINQRIKEFCKEIGITIAAFEKQCGLSNGYVKGISKCIGPEKMRSISLTFPQLNISWLLTGEGSMLHSPIQEVNGDNNTQVAGNNNNVNTPATLDKALDEIAAQRRLVEKSQQQIDRLLSIIENFNSKQ